MKVSTATAVENAIYFSNLSFSTSSVVIGTSPTLTLLVGFTFSISTSFFSGTLLLSAVAKDLETLSKFSIKFLNQSLDDFFSGTFSARFFLYSSKFLATLPISRFNNSDKDIFSVVPDSIYLY